MAPGDGARGPLGSAGGGNKCSHQRSIFATGRMLNTGSYIYSKWVGLVDGFAHVLRPQTAIITFIEGLAVIKLFANCHGKGTRCPQIYHGACYPELIFQHQKERSSPYRDRQRGVASTTGLLATRVPRRIPPIRGPGAESHRCGRVDKIRNTSSDVGFTNTAIRSTVPGSLATHFTACTGSV